MEQFVEQPLCQVDPDALALLQVRGLPPLGTWTVTYSGVAAASLSAELMATPNTTPSAMWSSANSDVTGLDIRFFVGTEGAGVGVTPAYAVE